MGYDAFRARNQWIIDSDRWVFYVGICIRTGTTDDGFENTEQRSIRDTIRTKNYRHIWVTKPVFKSLCKFPFLNHCVSFKFPFFKSLCKFVKLLRKRMGARAECKREKPMSGVQQRQSRYSIEFQDGNSRNHISKTNSLFCGIKKIQLSTRLKFQIFTKFPH